MIDLEAIYSKLFGLVKFAAPFVTTGRKWEPLANMNASQMPALYQSQTPGNVLQRQGLPPRWTLAADLVIYAAHPGNVDTPPSMVLNPLVVAVCALFDNDPQGNPQTLGGLVTWARVQGDKLEFVDGLLGNYALAVIPIQIMAEG